MKKHLADSKWSKQKHPHITTITYSNCLNMGEALRHVDKQDYIKTDFILVSGDTVSNMRLEPVLAAHRARREKDKNAIMTMVKRERQGGGGQGGGWHREGGGRGGGRAREGA